MHSKTLVVFAGGIPSSKLTWHRHVLWLTKYHERIVVWVSAVANCDNPNIMAVETSELSTVQKTIKSIHCLAVAYYFAD